MKIRFFARLDRVAVVGDAASFLFILAGGQRMGWICSHDSEPSLPYLSRFNIITTFQIMIVSFRVYLTFISTKCISYPFICPLLAWVLHL